MSSIFRTLVRARRSYVVVILLLGLQTISSCMQFRISDKKVAKAFRHQYYKPSFDFVDFTQRKIHVVEVGNDSLPTVFFIHGSPGDWSAFIEYFKDSTLLAHAHLAALDRTGYGKSDFGNGEPSLHKQTELYKEVLKKFQKPRKPVLVVHSYGGAVAAQIAINYPDIVSGIVILAGTVQADYQKPRWYNHMAEWWIVRWWLPRSLKVSNDEMMQLEHDLRILESKWDSVNIPITVIHGTKDRLVDYREAEFLAEKLKDHPNFELITLQDVDHFIPWTHYDTVQYHILNMLAKTQ